MIARAGLFDLIETMAFDPAIGVPLLDFHIARLDASARALGFLLDRHALRNDLQAATFGFVEPRRLRLLLARSGALVIEARAPTPWPDHVVPVGIAPRLLESDDVRVRHKTTDRRHLAKALREAGTPEVLLVDAQGYLTEGSFTSIFVARGDRLLTPPLSRGLLPGVLRQSLIAQGRAEEADLRPADIAEGALLIGNAARGLVAASVVAPRG